MQIPIVDKTETKEFVTIPDKLINQPINPRFIAQVVRIYLSNQRQDTAHTKTRGEVSGGGRKPWRQKGTGRARHGSIRSPLWVGGGVIFGPRNQNHHLQLSAKNRVKARQLLLIDLIKNQRLKAVSSIGIKQPKTKVVTNWLVKLQVPGGKILIIPEKLNVNLLIGGRNIPGVSVVEKKFVNPYHLLTHNIVIVESSVIRDWLSATETKN